MELPQEFYVNYVSRREKDLLALTEASQANDAEVFKRIGHQIKGNAESFGFGELTAIASEIEKVGPADFKNKNYDQVLEKFAGWIADKKKIYFS